MCTVQHIATWPVFRCGGQSQAIVSIFRHQCGARLHWGKAGWPRWAPCFDGAEEYPSTWCHFGCAVQVCSTWRQCSLTLKKFMHALVTIEETLNIYL